MIGKFSFKYVILAAIFLFLLGCKQEEPECIPSGKKKVIEVEKTPLPKSETRKIKKDSDFCKACVRSVKGFFTCQTAWGKPGENRIQIKERAKEKACVDAGYTNIECPASAVLLQQCKGEEKTVKPTKLTNAMKNLLSTKGTAAPVAKPTVEKYDSDTSPVSSEKKQ